MMDAFGLRPALDALAARLAAEGYFVLVPNLFHRAGDFRPFDTRTVWGDEPERKRLMGLIGQATPEGTMRDFGLWLEWLKTAKGARSERVGMVGYCFGGTMCFRAAAAFPDRVAAIACIHGGGLVTEKADSPHLGASKVKAECYFACADEDRSCTQEHRVTLEKALRAADVKAQVEFFSGKKHGFSMSDFPVFDEDAAALHWTRVVTLFSRTLH